ncbi:purine permease 1-like [Lycium ferocissimum]|uniref:purine permease 1-like n=1 Tax=Lycium ferocissimum TaxID=112874 RepID=UPI002815D118|nr:purine permease 1-like [Lycium ferocissimum]
MDIQREQGANYKPKKLKNFMSIKSLLVLINCILISVGQISGVLLVRTYFLHGGKRKWLQSFLLTAGFPILILPISISYAKRKNTNSRVFVTPKLAIASAILGLVLGVCSYLYTFGMSYLPVSISSLLASTSLAFTAIFAYFIVKHKFTDYSINAVVLMMFGSVILGLHMNGDRPIGESNRKYTLGFVMTLVAAALHGFVNAGVEYSHLKAGVVVTFDLVMQMQFLISMFSTLFCVVAMIINKDFQAISREAEEFGLGQNKYYMILALSAIALQMMMIGSLGLIFCSTALLSGIVNALLVPVQQIFAVMFLPESFNSAKWMALAMCLWGFASYFYGEYRVSLKKVTKTKDATPPDQV